MSNRIDNLDPLDYTNEMPSLMSAWGRVDIHTVVAKFLSDSKVTGAYLEFGVGQGRSAVSAIRAYTRGNVSKEYYLFDSFRGLPKLDGPDHESEQFRKGDYAFSKAEVINFLEKHNITVDESIELNEGWIEESFANWSTKHLEVRAATVHIDVDLYSSCASVLSYIKPFLQNGTVLLFDDWNCFKASSKHGERRAVNEWLKINSNVELHEYCSYGWHGRAFIVEIDEA